MSNRCILIFTLIALAGCKARPQLEGENQSSELRAASSPCGERNQPLCSSWVLLFEPKAQRGCTGAIVDYYPHILTTKSCFEEISNLAGGPEHIHIAIGNNVYLPTYATSHPSAAIDLAMISLKRESLEDASKTHPLVGAIPIRTSTWPYRDETTHLQIFGYSVIDFDSDKDQIPFWSEQSQNDSEPFTDGTIASGSNTGQISSDGKEGIFTTNSLIYPQNEQWIIPKNQYVGLTNTERGSLAIDRYGTLVGIQTKTSQLIADGMHTSVSAEFVNLTHPRAAEWIGQELNQDSTLYSGGKHSFPFHKWLEKTSAENPMHTTSRAETRSESPSATNTTSSQPNNSRNTNWHSISPAPSSSRNTVDKPSIHSISPVATERQPQRFQFGATLQESAQGYVSITGFIDQTYPNYLNMRVGDYIIELDSQKIKYLSSGNISFHSTFQKLLADDKRSYILIKLMRYINDGWYEYYVKISLPTVTSR